MSTTTTAYIHNKPIITIQTLKFSNLPNSRLHFLGEFIIPKLVNRQNKRWVSNNMDKAFEISAFKESSDTDFQDETGNVSIGILEQEGLIHGSSRVSPGFAPSGFESILNNMSKWLMTAVFVAVGVIRHDALVLWAVTGSVVNVLLSNVLKKIINQDRPFSALKSDPGMPSSHAQSIFFIFLFAIISIIESLGANGLTIAFSGLLLLIGSYLSWLRVSQNLHTVNQVLVGAMVGSIFSILWFWSWDTSIKELFFTSLWVRIIVLLGAIGFSLGFTIYAVQNWIKDRQ